MGRILTKEDVKQILQGRFKEDTCTRLKDIPSPGLFKDIKKASRRIKEAIELNQKIAIVGDYDVDGVVSSVILSEFFDDLGVEYELVIPNRFSDGYGLNPQIVQRVDAKVIVTVDNGISALEAAQICKERGIDLIITDHHSVPACIPNAYAIVNPKQQDCTFPNSEICGAQVAWYLVASLKESLKIRYDLAKFLDLLSIAIMADMMELKDINRVMTQKGIQALNCSKRVSILAIKEYFSKDSIEADDISFLIAPLINSSGRMEDAIYSYEFLKSKSFEDAIEKLEYIVHLNNCRKDEEKILFEASLKQIKDDDNIIVVWGEEWHEGVIGIVASRLAKRFKKPAVVFCIKEDEAKGSARSVGEIDILNLIKSSEDILLGYGGHKGAAGVAIKKENLTLFKKQLLSASKNLTTEEFEENSDILGEILLKDVDFELLEILEKFEPYGQKNPKPNFILKNLTIKIDRIIGRDGRHLKLILQHSNHTIEALFFNYDKPVKRGDVVEIVCSISKNLYRGLVTPQLLIKELVST